MPTGRWSNGCSQRPTPPNPEVDQRAVDPAKSAFEDLLTTRQSLGEVVRYDGVPYRVELNVTTVTSSSAEFEGCVVDGAQVIDSKSGQVVNDVVTTSRPSGTLVQVLACGRCSASTCCARSMGRPRTTRSHNDRSSPRPGRVGIGRPFRCRQRRDRIRRRFVGAVGRSEHAGRSGRRQQRWQRRRSVSVLQCESDSRNRDFRGV